MRLLDKSDVSYVSGGIAPWLISSVIGCGLGSLSYYVTSSKPSLAGAAYACGVGAIGSVATNSLIGAAGGGIIGNLTQRPGMFGLGWGVQQGNPWK